MLRRSTGGARAVLYRDHGGAYDIGRAHGQWYAFRRDGSGIPLRARRLGRLSARIQADRAAAGQER